MTTGRAVTRRRAETGFLGRHDDGPHHLTVALRRQDALQEVEELLGEERVAAEIVEAERPPVVGLDRLEPDVEELLQQHWLRQCPRQSAGERGRAPQHVVGQPLGHDEIGDRDAPARTEHTGHPGQGPALTRREAENAVGHDDVHRGGG